MTIKEMNEKVVQPFGMLLKELAPVKGEVAMLLSTANLVLTYRDAEDSKVTEAMRNVALLFYGVQNNQRKAERGESLDF